MAISRTLNLSLNVFTLFVISGKLLAAFLNGLNDRNTQIKKAYANAIGHLVMYSKESSIEKLLNKLIKWYFEREDESVHFSCAWCINAIGKYSPDKLSLFNTLVLPFVFIAKQGKEGVSSFAFFLPEFFFAKKLF